MTDEPGRPPDEERSPSGVIYYLCAGCLTSGVAPEWELTHKDDLVFCRRCSMEGKPDEPLTRWRRLRLWLARRRR